MILVCWHSKRVPTLSTFSSSPTQSVAFPTLVLAVEVSVGIRCVQTAHFNSLLSGFIMLIYEACGENYKLRQLRNG